MEKITPFENPVYLTRPVLPDISLFTKKLEEIWDAKWLTNNGRQHHLFENRLRQFLKVPYCCLFNNGTVALITACRGLRLSGEVITTPFTFPATPHVLTWNNIRPIFCDISPTTFNLDAELIEPHISPETSAILAVHVYGTPCDVVKIQDIAARYGLKLIYDAAHAFGVEVNGDPIGAFGDISMFSFHATKTFHTAEGGALVFKEPGLKERIDYLKNFGIKNEEEVVMPGINGKMNEIQAALGLLVLDLLQDEIRKRKRLAGQYREMLRDVEGISLPDELPNVTGNSQYFVIRVNQNRFGQSRDDVHDRLKEYNVLSRKYFYPLCSEYSCYRHLPSAAPGNLPVAHKVSAEVLCLPLHGELTPDHVEKICLILKNIQANPKR